MISVGIVNKRLCHVVVFLNMLISVFSSWMFFSCKNGMLLYFFFSEKGLELFLLMSIKGQVNYSNITCK